MNTNPEKERKLTLAEVLQKSIQKDEVSISKMYGTKNSTVSIIIQNATIENGNIKLLED